MFRANRLDENRIQARNLFRAVTVLSLVGLAMLAVFRVTFPYVHPLAIVGLGLALAVSLAGMYGQGRAQTPAQMEWVCVGWEWGMALAVVLLIQSHDMRALFLVLLLPTLVYMALQTRFRLCVGCGVGISLLLLYAYQGTPWAGQWQWGVALTVLLLNISLIYCAARTNQLQRLRWASLEAECWARQRQRESERQLQAVFQAVPLPLVVTRLSDGQILRFNEATLSFYGGSASALRSLNACHTYVDQGRRAALMARLEEFGRITDFELSLKRADGQVRNVVIAAAPVELNDEGCLVSALIDVTERVAVEQQVRHAAQHDSLTGLPNRAAFQERLQAVLANRGGTCGICLLLVDLDGLKDANDSLGHDAGDAVLCEIARRLVRLAGEGALVARLGGDEFVIMLEARDALRQGQRLAHAIVSDLRRPFAYARHHVSTRASIGIASCPEHDCSYRELMKGADLALYAAKQQGRNRYVVYTPDMRQAVQARINLLRAMAEALERDEIQPYYQPKINLATGRLEGFEALVRWRRSKTNVLTPASFELALSDPEMSVLLSERIVERVTQDVSGWISAGYPCGRIAINLAAAQFSQRDLAASLLGRFRAGGVDPSCFDVEITETVFLGRDIGQVRATLHALRMMGVGVSFDDFGTGYAALVHLKQLPIDVIKIDRGFVKDIERDPFDTAIVRAVIDLARELRMAVVAEGVETAGQARFLEDCGCDVAQGYLFYRPMPAADVVALLMQEGEAAARTRRALFA